LKRNKRYCPEVALNKTNSLCEWRTISKTVVLRYRTHLESRRLARGTINVRLGAVVC
jgi:hypothetical protein